MVFCAILWAVFSILIIVAGAYRMVDYGKYWSGAALVGAGFLSWCGLYMWIWWPVLWGSGG